MINKELIIYQIPLYYILIEIFLMNLYFLYELINEDEIKIFKNDF